MTKEEVEDLRVFLEGLNGEWVEWHTGTDSWFPPDTWESSQIFFGKGNYVEVLTKTGPKVVQSYEHAMDIIEDLRGSLS